MCRPRATPLESQVWLKPHDEKPLPVLFLLSQCKHPCLRGPQGKMHGGEGSQATARQRLTAVTLASSEKSAHATPTVTARTASNASPGWAPSAELRSGP